MISAIIKGSDESIDIGTMKDIMGLKIWAYDELGLDLSSVKYLNEIIIDVDDDGEPFTNIIMVDEEEDLEGGKLDAKKLLRDLSKLPGQLPADVKNIVNNLRDVCMGVVKTGVAVYLS